MKKIRRRLMFLIILLCLAAVYVIIEPYWIYNKKIMIQSSEIPPSFNNTRIVFIADIHHGPFFSKNRVKKLVDRINALAPDVILLGGDYVHRSPEFIEPCFDELKNLHASIGKYGVLGNHDHWEDAERTRKSMEYAGIEILDNNAVWIYKNDDMIKIGGVGDMYTDTQDIGPTLEGTSEKDFVILLSHNPDYVERLTTVKIDLVLSGHTHGGQVTFFGLWAPILPSAYGQKYRTGIVDTGYTKVIVTNGVGTITPPVRFFARPEIVIIELRN